MKTTVEVSDRLMKEARARARRDQVTLREVLEASPWTPASWSAHSHPLDRRRPKASFIPMKLALLSLVLLGGAAGCSSFGAATHSTIPYRNHQPGMQAGGLYLYRPPDSATYWTRFVVLWDGKQVGELRLGGYLYFQDRPGRHTIEVKEDAPNRYVKKKTIESRHEVELKAGRNHIVRFPVPEGILLRFAPGHPEELARMREETVLFRRARLEE